MAQNWINSDLSNKNPTATFSSKHKADLSTSYDFIYGYDSHDYFNKKDRYIHKNSMEFPNYSNKTSKRQIDKFKDFTFKCKNSDKNRSERVSKTKSLSNYQKEVLDGANEMKEEVKLVMALQKADIDLRVLNYLFIYLQKVYTKNDSVPIDNFSRVWCSLIGRESAYKHPQLLNKLMHVIIDQDEKSISIQKLSKLVEISEFVPIRVKKDTNHSQELHYVMSSGSKGGHFSKINTESTNDRIKTPEENSLDVIMEFIWMKIEEKFHRVADAFRFFDQGNNSTVNKNEFRDGLERLKIKIPTNDVIRVFNYLDKFRIGYFTYQEFTRLTEEKRR